MTDTRRLSPQTTSSSGYHSDLSLTNESPQLTHKTEVSINEQKKTLTNKKLSRISTFIRKQYERAKSKLIPQKQILVPAATSNKSTSTTPLSCFSENCSKKSQPSLTSIHKQSSFIEPLYSIYVRPLYNNQVKIPFTTSIHDCHSHQRSHPLFYNSTTNNNQVNSHSYHRLASTVNHKTPNTHSYSIKPKVCQSYYPYKYIDKNYNSNRLTYAPLSDFISTTKSAFKPVKVSRRPPVSEQILPSDDPCDLEVAQYFHQTSSWNNRNYFDVYTKQLPAILPKQNYTETLC